MQKSAFVSFSNVKLAKKMNFSFQPKPALLLIAIVANRFFFSYQPF